jgi:4-amino-4-deoxy-L-arabinose transferase-like glycosyltransferase
MQPEEKRAAMERSIKNLGFSGEFKEAESALAWQYENHQPPLYYVLTAPVFAVISRMSSFLNTFLWIRIWTVFIASLTVPAMWMLARTAFDEKSPREAALLLAVLFPGLYPGVVRVSNDGLTAALACWAFVALIAYLKSEQPRYLYALAALLVAGLWTKAFFIPILGGALLALLSFRKWRQVLWILAAALLGSPWYIMNYRFSGAMTGLPETVIEKITPAMTMQALWKLDWVNLATVLRASHIWIGNWSLLEVRRWWYLIISWLLVLALLGFVRQPRKLFGRSVWPLILIYLGIVAALVYYAAQVFVHKGVTAAEGWYLTSFIPIEAVLFVAGAYALLGKRGKWLAALLGLCCLALTVYGAAFVALPYYTGLIHHNPSGTVTSFHPSVSDFSVMSSRLLRYHAAIPGFLPWLLLMNAIVFGVYRILKLATDK